MYVACPNCRGWMVGDGIPVGVSVLCPHCQKQFVMTQALLAGAVQAEASPPAGWSMAPGGPMTQMPPTGVLPMPGAMPQAGGISMPGGPGFAQALPVQATAYAQAGAPTARTPTQPRVRPRLLSAEAILIMGFSLMIAAVVIVVVLGYGGRPAAENIGKPSEKAALAPTQGPLMIVSYDLRRRIVYIENVDRNWQEAELRINPDPADEEGGYRCQLGEVPRGRKKPVLLDQCLSPSGARFQGDLQRIVVVAKTADGELRYVSDFSSSSK